jgi:hypothetical protein|tara:strand:+ start:725 stop:1348 length:624 start_codon:yes stop_codon:yes gene_type:complete
VSNFNKLKLYPNVSISGGTNKQGPVEVKKESRTYGIKGDLDIYDKKDTKITISGNYSKSSGKDRVKYKGKEYVFEGESKPSYGIGIIFKKKFKKGGYNQGTCWDGYVQKGMKKKGNKMVPNCVPAGKMKTGGLTKWFNEKWVDIGAKKKGGKYQECGRKSASGSSRKYPKCVPLAKATAMTKSQKASAVARKRSTSNAGPKPNNVRT